VVDLGTFEDDVKFAWAEASRLKHSFVRAAAELEQQAAERAGYAEGARKEWRGRYAREFTNEHMMYTIRDVKAIAQTCRDCASMLEQLAQLAREENERRALARQWKSDHDKWQREQADDDALDDLGDLLGGDDEPKPPNLPENKPHPLVARSPPVSDRG